MARSMRGAPLRLRLPTVLAVLAVLAMAAMAISPMEKNDLDVTLRVNIGVLGLLPEPEEDPNAIACDRLLYEQVAMRIALDDIQHENYTIIELEDNFPVEMRTSLQYTGKAMNEIVGNVTTWAKQNIEWCAQHEIMHNINTTESVMLHSMDDKLHTVDALLGPRSSKNFECGMLKQMASLGRFPMVTWGCTPEDMNGDGNSNLDSTTISMLPEYTDMLRSHAIMDFLHDYNWDQGHVAVIYEQGNKKILQLIEALNEISSCSNSPHEVRIHGYGIDVTSETELDETLEQIKATEKNIILSAVSFPKLPLVMYKAKALGMVFEDNVWIFVREFTPTQLKTASTQKVCDLVWRAGMECDERDADLHLGELLHGSFALGWTPGGADYTTLSNPWERFKAVWSEKRPEDYPDLDLPEDFFSYPPLSANAALVYDSAWIALVTFLKGIASRDHFYDVRGHDHDAFTHVHGENEEHFMDSIATNGTDHSESDENEAHLHVCAQGFGKDLHEGLTFKGVTGSVHINKDTDGRVPVANILSATNLQWHNNTLEPYIYGKWPYNWHTSWKGQCDFPSYSLWERRQQLTPIKYGSSEKPPAYNSRYSNSVESKGGLDNDKLWLVIIVLVVTLTLLTVCILLLYFRYRRAHQKILKNEKVVNDFQYEWETNAGKALTMLSSVIDTMGDKKHCGETKASHEEKLAQIKRFLLAQDARVEMKSVKSSIEKVGAERYTPEVTAYLMAQALNNNQFEKESQVYERSNSFRKVVVDESDIETVLMKSMKNTSGMHPAEEGDSTEKKSFQYLRTISSMNREALEVISPVVDEVIINQVKTNLIASLNLAANGDATFNVFELARLTGDRPLSTLALYLLHRGGVCTALRLDRQKMIAFVVEVENMMFEHPYHNRRHVADVVAGIYAFTLPGGCLYDLVHTSPLALLAVVFAATIHDLQHTGVNNNYLTRTLHPLAIRHSDKSVNENHHLSCAFDLLGQDDFKFMEVYDGDDYLTFRSLVIEMVLATDMKSHFSILDSFRRFQKSRHADMKSVDRAVVTRNVFAMAMKVADLIHCSRPLELHHKWVDLITKEFLQQGDLEREKGLKVSPGMDRSQPPGPLQQVGFTEIFVLPLFREWRDYARDFGSQEGKTEILCYEGVEKNYKYWLHASKTSSVSSLMSSVSASDDSPV